MLMKLTLGVEFTNIVGVDCLYESILHSFSLITVWLCIFLGNLILAKSCSYNADEIDNR